MITTGRTEVNGITYDAEIRVTKGLASMDPMQPDDSDEIEILSLNIINDMEQEVFEDAITKNLSKFINDKTYQTIIEQVMEDED